MFSGRGPEQGLSGGAAPSPSQRPQRLVQRRYRHRASQGMPSPSRSRPSSPQRCRYASASSQERMSLQRVRVPHCTEKASRAGGVASSAPRRTPLRQNQGGTGASWDQRPRRAAADQLEAHVLPGDERREGRPGIRAMGLVELRSVDVRDADLHLVRSRAHRDAVAVANGEHALGARRLPGEQPAAEQDGRGMPSQARGSRHAAQDDVNPSRRSCSRASGARCSGGP